jgi:CspA family cold shock protein
MLYIKMEGTVKFFNKVKGFGFIESSEGGKDIFVHNEGLAEGVETINDGDKVTFDTTETEKGPAATNVQLSE